MLIKIFQYIITAIALTVCWVLHDIYLATVTGIAPSDLLGICSSSSDSSCAELINFRPLHFFNLPWSAWGLVYFLILLATYLIESFFSNESFAEIKGLRWILLISGNIISVFLLGLIFLKFENVCFYCLSIHVLNISLFILLLFNTDYSYKVDLAVLFKSAFNLFKKGNRSNTAEKYLLLSIIILILMSVAIIQRLEINFLYNSDHIETEVDPVKEFNNVASIEIPSDPEDAIFGNQKAYCKIVVFSDFECPYCSELSFTLKELSQEIEEDIKIVFKHFPLSSDCNPDMDNNMHPNSCNAAIASQAANYQNGFWKYHDFLFSNDIANVNLNMLSFDLNMDTIQFQNDMERAMQKVQRDIILGNELGLTATPSLFLNGRFVQNTEYENLKTLIFQLVSKSK